MIKKVPEGESLRCRLEQSVKDRLYHFLLDYGSVRGALLHAGRLVSEMRANHELGPLETLVLGHAYIGAALMSVNLKGSDRLKLQVQCSGPVQGCRRRPTPSARCAATWRRCRFRPEALWIPRTFRRCSARGFWP